MTGSHTDLPRPDQLALAGVNETQQRLAAQAVHRAATDEDDERELLDALGLLPTAPINTRTEVTP